MSSELFVELLNYQQIVVWKVYAEIDCLVIELQSHVESFPVIVQPICKYIVHFSTELHHFCHTQTLRLFAMTRVLRPWFNYQIALESF